ncbi:MAG: sulfurtransferase TusA family protein [Candidatus Binataceae bacterium]
MACTADMVISSSSVAAASPQTVYLDLTGVKCPLNWARAKVRLEQMRRHDVLELVLDDPRGVRDIPTAAEAEGYAVLECISGDGTWRIRIER